jgi:hypothetical protein
MHRLLLVNGRHVRTGDSLSWHDDSRRAANAVSETVPGRNTALDTELAICQVRDCMGSLLIDAHE